MNYILYTTRGPQLSLYSLAPSFRVSLPPCFFLSCDTGTVCWCKPVRACRLACFIITPEMSAQTALCHLPKFLCTLSVAVSAEVHTSPEWWKEHLFLAEVRQGRREARADIWENHQEDFTHLTFTCLHAVNITPWFFWMRRECWLPEGETGRGERERQGWKV